MIPTVDLNGRPIRGVFRDKNGALVVDDKKSLIKYNIEQKKSEEFIELKNRLEYMETLINKLLEKNNG